MSRVPGSTTQPALRAWARAVVAASASRVDEPIDLVSAVVAGVARAISPGHDAAHLLEERHRDGARDLADRLPEPPGGWADPWLPGILHEQAISQARRSARGAWYTPRSVVRGLVALATADGRPPSAAIDPTCGGGAFLLALLDRYRELGVTAEEALHRVGGTDIDPGAVRTSRWSMQLWAAANGVAVAPAELHLRVADVLDAAGPPDGVSEAGGAEGTAGLLVIGNPPFATPLRSGRLPASAESYRGANRDLLGPYCDLAAIHLLAALRSAGPGSTVALVQPQSVLAGRDTRALREHCDREAPLQALWATRTAVFDAGVRACAVVLRPGGRPPDLPALAAGPSVELVDRRDRPQPEPGHWAVHAARALGAPALPPAMAGSTSGTGLLGDLVTATAGFRDEYYGLVAACREWDGPVGDEPNRLVTVGSVDPLDLGWGRQTCRLGGQRWERPIVDLDRLDAKVRAWVDQRLEPKVVLATQSRVLEPVVDREGRLVPATPLIAVSAPNDQLDLVAAVLLAPPVVAWAWQRWFGASLSVDALKLAARQVLELPLPADRGAWDEAAALVADADGVDPDRAASVARRVAVTMNRAYGADDAVLEWWSERARGGRRGSTGTASDRSG